LASLDSRGEIEDRVNKSKIKGSKKEYRLKNLDKIKESDKEYRIKKKDKLKEIQTEYYKKNQDKIKESQKEYRINNTDKIRDIQNEYYKNNIGEIKECHREYYIKNQDKIKKVEKAYRMKIRDIQAQTKPIIPYYSWKSRELSRKNLESIASFFQIKELSDWYRISFEQIRQFGGIILRYWSFFIDERGILSESRLLFLYSNKGIEFNDIKYNIKSLYISL
jgi:hypothetical protein